MPSNVHKRAQRHRRRRDSKLHSTLVGGKGLVIYNSWTFAKEEDRKNPAVIFEKFENQLEPKTSHRIHRYKLQEMRQERGEPVDNFISRIKNLAAKCQFRNNIEVKDKVLYQLIWGSRNPDVIEAYTSGINLTQD